MNEAKKPARILVVDDEERNRRLLVAMLEAEGHSASEAADGAQALELVRQSPPDIVLLDVMMPGIDGYEVARALKAAEATRSVPVVMVTALDDRESRLRGLEAGAEEFITKPVDRNELRIRVRNLLRLKEFSDYLANHNRILEEQVRERTAKVTRLNRVYAVLSGINALIVRVRDRQELFNGACRIAVEDGQFPFTWIGVLDPATQDVTPVVWAGESAEGLTRAKSSARDDDTQRGQGAVGRAIRERRPVFNNDIIAHSFGGPRVKEILRLGFRSQITLPLFEDKTVIGTLTMYAREPNFFDEEELKLLTELAADISFALENISRQQKLGKLSRIRAVSSEINAAIVRIRNRQELFEEACRIAVGEGKFVMAWIGMLDEATQAVQPVAKAGREEGFLERINLTIDPNATSNLALVVEAVAQRAPVVCNDVATDGRMRPWRAAALERGYRSTALLPLQVEQRAVGVFALYAPEPDFFDEDEMKLLIEIAGDVSFALQTIEKQEKLDYLSYYDTLTGLPNRQLFFDRLEQRVVASRRDSTTFAVIMLDVERFSVINETLGRQAGDELLRQLVRRVQGELHETAILGRLAADRFGIVTRRGPEAVDVAHMLEQVLFNIRKQPFVVGGKELRVGARAAVASFPSDGEDAETLFRNAEAALRNAKKAGEPLRFYAPQMNARVAERLVLENRLRQAVENEEFVLHYQPKISLDTGRISGVEALIRWAERDGNLTPPGMFIPVLEETGMILEVGRWVVKQALVELGRWRAAGIGELRVAVNVSPVQLRREGFVADVLRASEEAGVHVGGLELEITESLMMEDIEQNIPKLKAIRELGAMISIDDFGTGYSSLSYIAKLPINALKIDRSFVVGIADNPDSLSIVQTIISLAHSLKLNVVAEGVDSAEQEKLLRLLRCDEAQGFLFSKPVPADATLDLLRKQTKERS